MSRIRWGWTAGVVFSLAVLSAIAAPTVQTGTVAEDGTDLFDCNGPQAVRFSHYTGNQLNFVVGDAFGRSAGTVEPGIWIARACPLQTVNAPLVVAREPRREAVSLTNRAVRPLNRSVRRDASVVNTAVVRMSNVPSSISRSPPHLRALQFG